MNVYDAAVRDVRDKRRQDVDNGRIVWQTALDGDDALYDAYLKYQAEVHKNARGEKNALDEAFKKLATLAKRAGITKELIDPPYRCAACRDTGYVGDKYCKCVIKRVIEANGDNLALPTAEFESAKKTAPNKAIAKVYAAAEKYIADSDGKPFMILTGDSGTGKTVLAAAVAGAFMTRGAAVVTVTAFELVRRALEFHTQFSISDYVDRFTPMLDCDLLVIDDLGTESMLKNVTREYLYTIINERWLHKKRTIITTNLDPAAINARYGENILSRMFDKNIAAAYRLTAKNARITD